MLSQSQDTNPSSPGLLLVAVIIVALFAGAAVHAVRHPIIWQADFGAGERNDMKQFQWDHFQDDQVRGDQFRGDQFRGDQLRGNQFRGWPDGKIDINRATDAELCVLPGIGPSLARNIVADRQTNGPYTSVDELDRVPRIGLKSIEWFRRYATVRDRTALQGD